MSRIVVTDKGRLLQNELLKDVENSSFLMKQRDTVTNQSLAGINLSTRSPKRQNTDRKTYGGILGHYTINETIANELECFEEDDPAVLATLGNEFIHNKYLQNKIIKAQEDITGRRNSTKSEAKFSLPYIPNTNASHRNTSFLDHNLSVNSAQSNYYMGDHSERNGVDKYNKLLHHESSISRLVERHIQNNKTILQTAKKVLENYDKKVRSLVDQNHKPPELLDSLKDKNPEAIDVLMRNTNSAFRKQDRINNYWKDKYKPHQEKFSNMTTKRFDEYMGSVHKHTKQVLPVPKY